MTFLFVLAVFVQDPGSTVTLREEAVVGTDYVRLMDLAAEERLSEEQRARLEAVYLGRAPELGKKRVITADDIRRELRLRGLDGIGVTLVGTSVVVSRGEAEAVSERDRFARMVAFEIRNQAAIELKDVSVKDLKVRVTHVEEAPEGASTWIDRVVRRGGSSIGVASYVVELKHPKTGDRQAIRAVATVQRLREVAFAARPLPRGFRLRREDLKIERIACDGSEDYAFQIEYLTGGKTLERIASGAPIRTWSVRLRPVFRRNALIRARSRFITVEARALDDGVMGEVILVENASSKKRFTARVVSATEVEYVGN